MHHIVSDDPANTVYGACTVYVQHKIGSSLMSTILILWCLHYMVVDQLQDMSVECDCTVPIHRALVDNQVLNLKLQRSQPVEEILEQELLWYGGLARL